METNDISPKNMASNIISPVYDIQYTEVSIGICDQFP